MKLLEEMINMEYKLVINLEDVIHNNRALTRLFILDNYRNKNYIVVADPQQYLNGWYIRAIRNAFYRDKLYERK